MKTVVTTLVMGSLIAFSGTSFAMVNDGAFSSVKLGNSRATEKTPCPVYAEAERDKENESRVRRSKKLEGFGIDDVESYSRDSLNKLTRL